MLTKCYNKKKTGRPGRQKRCAMPKVMLATLVLCLLAFGCEDNEITFFVEHMKTQPEAPTCETSESDAFSARGLLDLSFGNSFSGFYFVTNHLMAREDYGNLRAETNGITIDGMEVYVRGMDGTSYGSTEYYEFEQYVPPEDSTVAYAVAIPTSVTQALSESLGCLPLNGNNYPGSTIGEDANGQIVPRYFDSVYSVVRFLGHSQGGSDVQTPEFTYPIDLCCGCLLDWANCMEGDCGRYCVKPDEPSMCHIGSDNGGTFDCRTLYFDPEDASWDCSEGTCDCTSCAATSS